MPQVEPSVLTALMAAAKDAVSNTAVAFSLTAMDVGSSTTVEQRDALVAALRRRPAEVLKPRKEEREAPPTPPTQLEIWSLYADHVDDPLLRGHLHHLLLDAGHGRRPDPFVARPPDTSTRRSCCWPPRTATGCRGLPGA